MLSTVPAYGSPRVAPELVMAGLDDLRAGRATVEALLVSIAASRLRDLGVDNALVQRITSFERALACVS